MRMLYKMIGEVPDGAEMLSCGCGEVVMGRNKLLGQSLTLMMKASKPRGRNASAWGRGVFLADLIKC